ncbi:MAG TPA: S8 family serine peptidase [Bryobacteraceae bacterium]|nr:S8 family serine peptidase [Bryobacteraceae bacterium]
MTVTTAAGEQRYILRARSGAVHGVAARYGLRVLAQAEAGDFVLALVADPAGRPSTRISDAVRAEADVASLEADQGVVIPEAPPGLLLNQSTVAVLDGALTVPYFGRNVWKGYIDQPASSIIRIPQAHMLATGGGVVAVIDTGVDPQHPVLATSLAPGYDFLDNQPGWASELASLDQSTVAILDATAESMEGKSAAQVNQSTVAILDQSTVAVLDLEGRPPAFGHGTMVAGLIHLVAPTARIMPLRAFQSDGSGRLFDVLRAIYYAVDHGARVINMSFSVSAPSRELQQAIIYANSRRVICIAAAGNSGNQVMVYPAGWHNVDGVGSTNNSDERSGFSNYGDDLVALAAPGEALITPYPGKNYAAASGTSFSTALVSGAAALLVEIDGRTNQAQAEAALSQAVPVPQLGAGRIDLFQACMYALRH